MHKHLSKGTRIAFASFLLLFSFLGFSTIASAQEGSLFISPNTGVYKAGDFFTVRVLVNTDGSPINAAEGVLTFNNTELLVSTVSQAGSIFNLWTLEPEFSNNAGTINFGGGSPKGYTGASGQIFSITFKAVKATTAKLNYRSGVILAADGRGTNIVSELNGGNYTITAKTTAPEPEYVAPANTPSAPKVLSGTHPDSDKWYTENDVTFSWSVPDDVVNVRLTADENPGTIPAVFYSTPITKKEIEDFDQGAWYLHVQFKNKNGWGRVTHFPFNIDSDKPESFTITQTESPDPTDPRMSFLFEAEDAVSGVSDYEIVIDDGETFMWEDAGSGIFTPLNLAPGNHTMVVKALDKAGNYLVDSITFSIESLSVPKITDYPATLDSNSVLVVRGVSLPLSEVTIYFGEKGEEPEVSTITTDENGRFTFVMDEKPSDGIYHLWAEVIDSRGAKSDSSEKITIAVKPTGFVRLGNLAISYLSIIVPLIGLIILGILVILYGMRRLLIFRKKVRKEATEAEQILHESFTKLHFEVQKHVKKLESARKRRALTKDEEVMVKELNQRLDEAEAVVGKEIEDITKLSR